MPKVEFKPVSEILEVTTCCGCGGVFAMASDFIKRSREIGNFQMMHFCPYCATKQGWGESTNQRLRREKAQLESRIEREEARTRDARARADHLDHVQRGLRGVIAKTKKRVGRGVCPCCNRTFQDLARHMTTQHPQYAD